MTRATLPTPRNITRSPVIREPSAFSALGDALQVAGAAGQQYEQRRRDTDERVAEIDHRIAMDEQKRQDDARYIEEAQRWVQVEAETTAAVAELRQQAGPFARGHDEAVRELIADRYRAFDEGLADNDRVRQRLRLTVAQSASQIDVRETLWQRSQEFEAQGEALQNVVNTRRNQLTRATPEEAEQAFVEYGAEIDAMIEAGAFNADQQAKMRRAAMTQLALGLNDGMFNAGRPDLVQAAIDKGVYDELDLDVDKLSNQVASETRTLEIKAEREAAAQLAQARDAADAIEAKIRAGINPTQDEFDAVNAALSAAGAPEDERIDFGALTVQMGLNRQFSPAADPDGIGAAQAAAELQAKIANGTADEAEQVAFAHLSGVADERAREAGRRRKEMAEQGVQGQLSVLEDLDRLPREQRFVAANEAMDGLGYVAGLAQKPRRFALSGREARAARKDDFGTKAEVEQAFGEATGGFAAMLGGSYDDMLELAWDVYAGDLASLGRTGWDADKFESVVDVVFGASRRPNGEQQGGVGEFNGHRVILPAYLTENEFEARLRAIDFSNAVYSDGTEEGTPAVASDVLEHYRPEYTRDASNGLPIYRMIDEGGRPLMSKRGQPFELMFSSGSARRSLVRGTPQRTLSGTRR